MKLPLDLKKRCDDLIVANALAFLLLALVVLLPDSSIRTILGLIFILLLPGYVAVAALFPSGERIDWIERAALSLGLSVAIVPLIGLALNYTPWGIVLWSILTALMVFIVGISVLAYFRRIRLPEEERLTLELEIDLDWKRFALIDKILLVGILVVLVATISIVAYAISNPPQGERFTQFALLDQNHRAENYPGGAVGTVEICIGSNEGADTDYALVIVLVEDTDNYSSLTYLDELPPVAQLDIGQGIALNVTVPDEEWVNTSFSYEFDDTGTYKLRFLLYLQGDMSTPYREVYLWLTN